MALNFESIKEELSLKKKAIVRIDNKRFIIKKKGVKNKMRPSLNWFLSIVLNIILFFISLFLISVIISIPFMLADEFLSNEIENINGTVTSISYSGILAEFSNNYWYILLIIFLICTRFLYNKSLDIIMCVFFKKEKQIVYKGLI